jgi:hypothetical protein
MSGSQNGCKRSATKMGADCEVRPDISLGFLEINFKKWRELKGKN